MLAQITNMNLSQVKLCDYEATERAWELMALADMPAKILSFKLRNYTIPAVQMSDRNKGLEGFHLAEL